MANTVTKAIEVAKQMIADGVVYGYGFKYEKITQARINQFAAMYPSTYTTKIKTMVEKKVGKIGIDCSGFVCRAFGISNIGSSQIKSKMTHLYSPADPSKLVNGMVIWRQGHIALIEVDSTGEAWILEAKGTAYDLTRTKFSSRGSAFTYYGELSGINYAGERHISNVKTKLIKTATKELIDVSKYNTLDWSKVSYTDVIIRVGYRAYRDGALTLDAKFVEHARNSIEHGMKIGVYFYDQSINEAEAIEQADWVAGLIKALPISYPVYIDSEYSNKNHNGRADNISKDSRTANIVAFCERIKSHGYKAGVYAADSWYKSMVDFDKLKDYSIWVARYSTNPPTINKYDMWQYGSAYISGSANPIDVNKLYTSEVQSIDTNTKYCTITASKLNVRNAPNGTILEQLVRGTKVNVMDYKDKWCCIGTNRWVSYNYLQPTNGMVVNCNKLNVRENPVDGNVIKVITVNTKLEILGKKSDWYYVKIGETIGFVSPKYIEVV